MITSHELKKLNNENIILLYLDFSIEVGSFDTKQKQTLLSTVKEYLKKIKLNNNYQKILVLSSGIVIATILCIGNDMKLVSDINMDYEPVISEKLEIPSNVFREELILSPNMNKENIEEKSEEATLEQVISNEDSDFKEIDNSIVKEEIKNNISSTSQQTIKEEQKHLDNQNEYIQTEINTEVNNSQNVESKPETNSSEAALVKQQTVTIYRSNGSILEIELEEYIVGVVAAEMPASFSSEALKAQAVVARTYALKRVSTGQKLTDTVSTQAYIDVSQMKQKWGNDFSKYYNKIKKAVEETTGEYITYNGEYINAVYHSTSNGYTEDAKNVWQESYPYLKSVESIWDKNVSSYQRTITKDYNNLLDVTGLSDENLEINILNRNTSGRVETIQVGNNIYTGVEFRNLLGLRSTDFDIEFVDGNIQITTRGYGHGVGMSQYGANEMSKQGYNYRQIIGHYYTDVQIQK